MTNIGNRATVGTLLSLHALTSVHWGAGASIGTVDLPIQRERHTDWPNGAGSALKGVLRDACREGLQLNGNRKAADEDPRIRRLFGSAKSGSEESNAGALSVSDARLLAMPVRSLKGVFAWISCPTVIDRLKRDASLVGLSLPDGAYEPADQQAFVTRDCPLKVSNNEYLQLDDETLKVGTTSIDVLAEWIGRHCLPDSPEYVSTRNRFIRQFVIVPDNVFTHFSKYATEVVARIGLDYNTRTVKTGALFYQELLPAESLMYAVLLVNSSRTGNDAASGADTLISLHELLKCMQTLQVGGDETTGKGFCAVHFSSRGGVQ